MKRVLTFLVASLLLGLTVLLIPILWQRTRNLERIATGGLLLCQSFKKLALRDLTTRAQSNFVPFARFDASAAEHYDRDTGDCIVLMTSTSTQRRGDPERLHLELSNATRGETLADCESDGYEMTWSCFAASSVRDDATAGANSSGRRIGRNEFDTLVADRFSEENPAKALPSD